jgi:hypothetical protein
MKTGFVSALFFSGALALACSQKDIKQGAEDAKAKAGEAQAALADAAGSVKENAGGAKAALEGAAAAATAKAGEVKTAAEGLGESLVGAASTALAAAEKVKSIKLEIDKVYQSKTDYDLVVSEEGVDDAAMKAHEAKISALPSVEVKGVKVAYEEVSGRSLNGVSYSRAFGASWVAGGKRYGVTYYSNETIDAKAFAALLEKLVPVVETYLK